MVAHVKVDRANRTGVGISFLFGSLLRLIAWDCSNTCNLADRLKDHSR